MKKMNPVSLTNPSPRHPCLPCRRWVASCVALAGLAMVTGCGPSDLSSPPPPAVQSAPTSAPLGQVQGEYRQPVAATGEYAYDRRQEFVSSMRAKHQALRTKIGELSTRADQSAADVREEAKEALRGLEERTTELGRSIERAEAATESTWESTRAGLVRAYDNLEESVERARQWLSERIAP